jgi:hypothetical protein
MSPANTMHAQACNDPTAPAVRALFLAVSFVLDAEHALQQREPQRLQTRPVADLLRAARALGWRPIGEASG